jgi:YbbR domain-containing protein
MIDFIRNLVVKDFWLKLFSFILAVLIWLTVQFSINNKEGSTWAVLIGQAGDEGVFTIPVSVPAGDARLVSVTPAEVQVTVRGEPKLIKSLKPDDIRAQVNLTGVESANGLHRRVEVVLPPGIAYTHLIPEEVDVRVSPRIE